MNEIKYNLYFSQLLSSIKDNKDTIDLCQKINNELEKSIDECKIIFLSQFTDNTIKLFNFDKIQQVEQYIGNLQKWLNQIPCLSSIVDIHAYSFIIQYVIISKIYFPEIDLCFKNNFLNQILDNIDLINNNIIKITFLNYCLNYHLQQGISITYKETCDKIVNIIEKILKEKEEEQTRLGCFKLPLLERELEE